MTLTCLPQMSVKAWFETSGRVKMISIHSPASQCNIVGFRYPREEGTQISVSQRAYEWATDLVARYGQAKRCVSLPREPMACTHFAFIRHLWGSLFVIRLCVDYVILLADMLSILKGLGLRTSQASHWPPWIRLRPPADRLDACARRRV